MNAFCPDTGEELLGTCIESTVSLTNAALTAFSAETRAHIRELVFAGARIAMVIELTPHPSVVCTVEAHGRVIEFFRVVQPSAQRETTH